MPIRRRVSSPDTLKLPPLPSDSKLLVKCPLLREFLTAREYSDGTPRTPGYFTLRPGVLDFACTLSDPDACQRATVRARNLDDLFAGLELLLGAEDGPWEPDNYLLEQAAKKTKKKR